MTVNNRNETVALIFTHLLTRIHIPEHYPCTHYISLTLTKENLEWFFLAREQRTRTHQMKKSGKEREGEKRSKQHQQ